MSRQEWTLANAHIGLEPNEICPGTTVEQHAESLAMWELHNMPEDNKAQALAVTVLASARTERFYGAEEEIESR
jgi:hypothetical protein